MRNLFSSYILLSSLLILSAEESPKETKAPTDIPNITSCIPNAILEKKTPSLIPFRNGLEIAVSTSNEEARKHTLQGLNHLHGGWEFEARRHFAAAITADPECLLAHWGLIMTMLATSPETHANRLAATERLIHLIEKNKGSDIERGFAYALITYIKDGSQGATIAFRKVSDKFPDDIQATIFSAIFSRSGYDDSGNITPSQAEAEKRVSELIEKNPDNVLPLHALLALRAEAPDLRPSLELARKLCEIAPDYPPYFHLLGHYEWRCGEHTKAASAFAKTARLYSNWMKQNNITPADCPEWIRAESYRIVALASKGDFDNAIASAEKIARSSLDPQRPSAPGNRILLWETKTLPARILIRRGLPGDSAKALAALPTPEETEPFRKHSLFYWWIDGLRISLQAQSLLEEKNTQQASKNIDAISFHGINMAKLRNTASSNGEYNEWKRSFLTLETIAAELRGKAALLNTKERQGSAFNWFRAATDRQRPATMLNPPLLLTPMASLLGDYFMSINKAHKAVNAYKEAIALFPNDQITLEKLKKAQELALTQPNNHLRKDN